jgi:hypothetical protein
MRKLALVLVLSLGLSGCAAIQRLETIYSEVSGSTISPQQVYIAVNAFDAAKATVAQYFNYCRPFVNVVTHRALASAPAACSDNNRRTVIKYSRAGTAARNQLETYLIAGTAAPTQIYQTLVAAVGSLKLSAIASGAAQ